MTEKSLFWNAEELETDCDKTVLNQAVVQTCQKCRWLDKVYDRYLVGLKTIFLQFKQGKTWNKEDRNKKPPSFIGNITFDSIRWCCHLIFTVPASSPCSYINSHCDKKVFSTSSEIISNKNWFLGWQLFSFLKFSNYFDICMPLA